jgi:cellulose synthase/poly-beta-1,6-N-acetylglucosamine synthase-like glycosyltransferase
MGVLAVINTAAVIVLSVYALHQGLLLFLYLGYRLRRFARRVGAQLLPDVNAHADEIAAAPVDDSLPRVTVQLPLYNERYVAEQVIAAACALDYPRELLQVQVLDDSTDDTSHIAQRAALEACARGMNVEFIHRDNRDGFKAGALANGLATAQGELVAIFDADFIPPRNFLQRIICERRAFDDPGIGFVQARWGYLNREVSALTRAQVVMLDMHFVIDQVARNRAGLRMNFNGSGGIWRRACLDTSGGWQSDTLTEDLDMSYRAQLHNWRGLYLEDEVCPGELPLNLLAFKRQQARWARGSAQCVRKLLPRIARSGMPLLHKFAALMHLSGYFANVFVVLLAFITPLLLMDASGLRIVPQWLGVVSIAGTFPFLAMSVAQGVQGSTADSLQDLPVAILLGIGVSLANSVGVLVGLFGRSSGGWERTPKSVFKAASPAQVSSTSPHNTRTNSRFNYVFRTDWTVYVELALGIYALAACLLLIVRGFWLSAAPLMLYAGGFLMVVWGQVSPSMRSQTRARARQRKI